MGDDPRNQSQERSRERRESIRGEINEEFTTVDTLDTILLGHFWECCVGPPQSCPSNGTGSWDGHPPSPYSFTEGHPWRELSGTSGLCFHRLRMSLHQRKPCNRERLMPELGNPWCAMNLPTRLQMASWFGQEHVGGVLPSPCSPPFFSIPLSCLLWLYVVVVYGLCLLKSHMLKPLSPK